jgi:pyridoxamine 5'-phosphate oxidase
MITAGQLTQMRKEYSGEPLDTTSSPEDPFNLFTRWFHEALEARLAEPNAMILATANSSGIPSARTVLLKIFDSRGFVFFTNYSSHKGSDISENPKGELLFVWLELERQVRIYGVIERTTVEESDQYFASRPYNARLGAIASTQSHPIENDTVISNKIDALRSQYSESSPIPRPDYWGGYRLVAESFEFWQGRPNRLHSRLLYTRDVTNWKKTILAP